MEYTPESAPFATLPFQGLACRRASKPFSAATCNICWTTSSFSGAAIGPIVGKKNFVPHGNCQRYSDIADKAQKVSFAANCISRGAAAFTT